MLLPFGNLSWNKAEKREYMWEGKSSVLKHNILVNVFLPA